MKLPRVVICVLAGVACLWAMLLLFVPSAHQESLFFASGQNSFFFDYFTPYEILSADHPYVDARPFPKLGFDFVDGGIIPRRNQCYPALPILFVNLFNESVGGAFLCSLIGLCCYLLGLVVFLRKYKIPVLLPVTVLLVSSQVLFTYEVGNLIFYAGGAVLLYFSWYDSSSRLKRFCAALALALASVFKVYLVVLGLAYLLPGKPRDWKGAITSGILFCLLLILPFVAVGGFDGLVAWFADAHSNSVTNATLNRFGLYGLISELVAVLGYRYELADTIHLPLRIFASAFAVLLLVRAFMKNLDGFSRICLISLGMLFLPPTMMCYTVLYVVPLFIVGTCRYEGRMARTFGMCWLFSCMPLQIPLLFGSANVCFVAAAMLDLCVVLLRQRKLKANDELNGNELEKR